MPQIDTRHAEKAYLFQLYKAKHDKDIDSAIASMVAVMEEEDVQAVKKSFDNWKQNKEQ